MHGQQRLPNGNYVDWTRGLLTQIWEGRVSNCYSQWIDVICQDLHVQGIEARLFDTEILEYLSRSPWWIGPFIHFIWACLEMYWGDWLRTWRGEELFIFSIGWMVAWTWLENTLHRAFHLDPDSSPFWQCFHFILHGYVYGLLCIFSPRQTTRPFGETTKKPHKKMRRITSYDAL